jgi:hypothetical protein
VGACSNGSAVDAPHVERLKSESRHSVTEPLAVVERVAISRIAEAEGAATHDAFAAADDLIDDPWRVEPSAVPSAYVRLVQRRASLGRGRANNEQLARI